MQAVGAMGSMWAEKSPMMMDSAWTWRYCSVTVVDFQHPMSWMRLPPTWVHRSAMHGSRCLQGAGGNVSGVDFKRGF